MANIISVDKEDVVTEEKNLEAIINYEKIDEERKLLGYNLLITSETKMNALDIYDVYHRLW